MSLWGSACVAQDADSLVLAEIGEMLALDVCTTRCQSSSKDTEKTKNSIAIREVFLCIDRVARTYGINIVVN